MWLTKAVNSAVRAISRAGSDRTTVIPLFGSINTAAFPLGASRSMSFADLAAQGYAAIPVLRACVDLIGDSLGQVRWYAVKDDKDGYPARVVGHPLETLMKRPNPFVPAAEFYSALSAHLLLAGNAYACITWVRGGTVAKEMFLVRPDWIKAKPSGTPSYLEEYVLTPGGNALEKPISLPVDEVIQWRLPSPLDAFNGDSPLQSASKLVTTMNKSSSWTETLFDNSAVPSGILKVPAMLEKKRRAELKESITEEFTGRNRHRPLVLFGGMEWETIQLDPAKLNLDSLRKADRIDICTAMRVPPALVGAAENVSYSYFYEARAFFWEERMIPYIMALRDGFNLRLAGKDGVRLEPYLGHVPGMLNSVMRQADVAKKLVSTGWPLNAVNRRLGLELPALEWGNVAWMPSNMFAVSDETSRPTDTTTSDGSNLIDDGGDATRTDIVDPELAKPGGE